MGCLNSDGKFDHWFANIHLSGPCNRRCYFCIGQHMMGLDGYNNLGAWPLVGLEEFINVCVAKGVREINLTGTNTDPLLYRHHDRLARALHEAIPNLKLGIRTNGMAFKPGDWWIFDKVSITVCSLNDDVNARMMGGPGPDLSFILSQSHNQDVKINVVLGPENVGPDLFETLHDLACRYNVKRVNLREPYGQPHVGNPMPACCYKRVVLGMPEYEIFGMRVLYWDVHFVEVESVNLYASGRVSVTYPITLGYDPSLGLVQDQSQFQRSGRHRDQWVSYPKGLLSEKER